MEVQARHFDRILILQIQGTITSSDLLEVMKLLKELSGKILHVIAFLQSAQLDKEVLATLQKFKALYERSKIKFHLVSKNLPGMDAGTLSEALDKINSNESSRITELFMLEYEAQTHQKKHLQSVLKLATTLGVKEVENVSPMEAIRETFRTLEAKHAQLQQDYQEVSREVQALQKQLQSSAPQSNNEEVAAQIAQAKKKALAALKSSGALN